MAKLNIKPGSTDVTLYVFIQDSSSTTGAGLTGLTFESAGLSIYYVRSLSTRLEITKATQTPAGAHSDGGFCAVDDTNMPGVYRLDLPDAVCAVSARCAVVMLKGATNMAPVVLEVDLSSQVDTTQFAGQAITCGAGVTIGAYVGNATAAIAVDGSGYVTYANTAPPSAATIASQVRTELTTELGRIDAAVTTRSSHSAADVWTAVTRTLTAATNITSTGSTIALDGSGYVTYANAAPPSAATIATQVRTELTTELGRIDAAISSRGTSTLDAAGVRTAVGLASANLDTQLSTIDDYLDTEVAAIKAKTDLLTTFPTNFGSLSITAAGLVATTSNVKKNQALAKFQFLMTDSTNHAPATGKTVTVTRSIDGGAFGAGALSAVTELSNGIYTVDFAAADLNGNVIVLRATATACDDTFERIITQP